MNICIILSIPEIGLFLAFSHPHHLSLFYVVGLERSQEKITSCGPHHLLTSVSPSWPLHLASDWLKLGQDEEAEMVRPRRGREYVSDCLQLGKDEEAEMMMPRRGQNEQMLPNLSLLIAIAYLRNSDVLKMYTKLYIGIEFVVKLFSLLVSLNFPQTFSETTSYTYTKI